MSLVFNVFAGITLSISNYSKSIDYSYESLKPESYGFETTLTLKDKYYLQMDVKRIAAQVQSSSGNLNVFGYDYTHDFMYLKMGYKFSETQSIYLSPMIYYAPILFPVTVGALTSQAAFEKTLSAGLGIGYTKNLSLEKFKFDINANFSLMKFQSGQYEQNYSYLFDVNMHPSWKVSKSMFLGVNYNVIAGQSSLVEKKTGSDYPFKTTYVLHNLFLTFSYTLH